MATSGQYATALSVIDTIEDAFERIDRDPSSLEQRHLISARRSLNMVLRRWSGVKRAQHRIEEHIEPLISGTATYNLPTGGFDIIDAVVRDSDGLDLGLVLISKAERLRRPNKTTQSSRPVDLYVNRQEQPTLTVWPVPDNSNMSLVYNYVRYNQEVVTLGEDVDVVLLWEEAVVAKLAEKLAEKYAPERLQEKRALAKEAFDDATMAERDTSDTIIGVFGR